MLIDWQEGYNRTFMIKAQRARETERKKTKRNGKKNREKIKKNDTENEKKITQKKKNLF